MKWMNSIITKITIIFALAILGITSVLFVFITHQMHEETRHWEDYARYAIHSSFDRHSKKLDFERLKSLGFSLLKDKNLKNKIVKSYRPPPLPTTGNMPRRMMRLGIKAIAYHKTIYIAIHTKQLEPIVLKTNFEIKLFPTLLFPIIAIFLVILLYIAIIRSILPLYDLRKKIKKFSDGDYTIDCYSQRKDEIGILANEFGSAVRKIKQLKDSRQLFLRNIMHELKTPITKGKFVAELIENEKYKDSLDNIFSRQESLIEEFSRIEKLSADEIKLNIQEYNLDDIIDFSIDILQHERDSIQIDTTPLKLQVDFELFGTALKNLLDNGINYSIEHKVRLENTTDSLIISNSGEALEFELEEYAQPYFLKGKKQKSSRGLGFGLFISWHIIRLHKMNLTYHRQNERNIFIISINEKNS
jgi:two-component system OmpR family sensor kinase